MGTMTPLGLDTARALESVSIFTPLGIRLWDEALEMPVERGLAVQAYALDQPNGPVESTRSPSGIHVLQGLPGLGRVEHPPVGGGGVVAGGSVRFAITVEDTLGRFGPVLFGVALPLSYRGIFIEADPAQPGARLFLYSAPTRPVATGIAEIRAELWDVDGAQPAAFAVLRATLQGVVKHAIADERGRCLIEIPWPTVERLRLGSPPGQQQGAPIDQEWPITLEVLYGPAGFTYLLGGNQSASQLWRGRPSLKSVLEQPAGVLWPAFPGVPISSWETSLTFGSALILRTQGSSAGQLLISKGSSAP